MKKQAKKLQLTTETIKHLTAEDLIRVAGGTDKYEKTSAACQKEQGATIKTY